MQTMRTALCHAVHTQILFKGCSSAHVRSRHLARGGVLQPAIRACLLPHAIACACPRGQQSMDRQTHACERTRKSRATLTLIAVCITIARRRHSVSRALLTLWVYYKQITSGYRAQSKSKSISVSTTEMRQAANVTQLCNLVDGHLYLVHTYTAKNLQGDHPENRRARAPGGGWF